MNQDIPNDTDNLSVSSRQRSVKSERSLLDQASRDTRLHYRKDSPLGLTVEELDDRGLLDGGSVPTYYTSIRQRTRRPLEMRKRGARMQERDRESMSKLMDGLHHMIQTLVKRGLRIEEYCRQYDTSNCGMVGKKRFATMIRSIGLPLTAKDIAEVTNRYAVHSTDMVDFEALLRDAQVNNFSTKNNETNIASASDSIESLQGAGISNYTGTMIDVKRMMVESTRSLEKPLAEVYRMFARWDTSGTGTVTATQFIRVLNQLHVNLSDQDQDFIIELLDTSGQGRIDFESLLSFCFAETIPELGSPNGAGIRSIIAEDGGGQAFSGETYVSAGSNEGLNEQKSVGSHGNTAYNGNNNGSSRRPHTAKISRQSFPNFDQKDSGNRDRESVEYIYGGANGEHQSIDRSPSKNSHQRPLTASARVSNVEQSRRDGSSTKQSSSSTSHNQATDHDQKGGYSKFSKDNEDRPLVVELPDDVINDYEDMPGSLTPNSNYMGRQFYGDDSLTSGVPINTDVNDGASFNDNTLVTNDNEEYNFGSPQGIPSSVTNINKNFDSKDMWNSTSLDGLTLSQDSLGVGGLQPTTLPPTNNNYGYNNYREGNDPSDGQYESLFSPAPNEHLAMLAQQTLSTVREMIINRHQSGKSIQEIYQHFDRDSKGFFNTQDFIRATSDLRIETSERVAAPAIAQIAIDGVDTVSLGEFVVFVTDPDHWNLERKVQLSVSRIFEQEGNDFLDRMRAIFQEEDQRKGDLNRMGLLSTSSFINALTRLKLGLSISEMDRLIARFDIYGQGNCSVDRFMMMIQRSEEWRKVEEELSMVSKAQAEAMEFRKELEHCSATERIKYKEAGFTEEVIAMAEYLGICAISEQNLIWIAADALKAPLPVSWSAQRDTKDRVFFYNHLTNQSTWDHPLDPHFRQLRDKYRQSESMARKDIPTPGQGRPAHSSGRPTTAPRQPPNAVNSGSARPLSALHTGGSRSMLPSVDRSAHKMLIDPIARYVHDDGDNNRTTNDINHNSRTMRMNLHNWQKKISDYTAAISQSSNSRPVSAPHAKQHRPRSGTGWQLAGNSRSRGGGGDGSYKVENIYNSKYFNLSHYKQNGYMVEKVEEEHRRLANARNYTMLGASSNKRPQSGSAARRRSNTAGNNGHESNQKVTSFGSRRPMTASSPRDRGSVVDRAMYGEAVPTYLQPRQKSQWHVPQRQAAVDKDEYMNHKLANMYDDRIIAQLDDVVKNNDNKNRQPPAAPPIVTKDKQTKGGIVII